MAGLSGKTDYISISYNGVVSLTAIQGGCESSKACCNRVHNIEQIKAGRMKSHSIVDV